jgi:hypothetical protein
MRRSPLKSIQLHTPAPTILHARDCDRIVRVFRDRDYDISQTQAQQLWLLYSATQSVVWMGLPDQDYEIWECLEDYWHVNAGWCYGCPNAFVIHTNGVKVHVDANDNPLPELDKDHRPWNLYSC